MCLMPNKEIYTVCVKTQRCRVCGKEVEYNKARAQKEFNETTTALWEMNEAWYHLECYDLRWEDEW